MSDHITQIGNRALGSRLRRLSDLLMSDGAQNYKLANQEFKPGWFPLFHALFQVGPMSMGDAAHTLRVSHVLVNQVASELEKEGLIISERSSKDGRSRILKLSDRGRRLARDLTPVWDSVHAAIDSAIQDSGYDLMAAISGFERALDKKSFAERFKRSWNQVRIVTFEDRHATAYRELNLAWIRENFVVEPLDEEILFQPRARILDQGGEIYIAEMERTGEAVGTCALMEHGGAWELTKLAVDPKVQGLGIGRMLSKAVIEGARDRLVPRLFLETNKKLVPAIRLYEQLGFRHENPPKPSDYERANVYMVLDLNKV